MRLLKFFGLVQGVGNFCLHVKPSFFGIRFIFTRYSDNIKPNLSPDKYSPDSITEKITIHQFDIKPKLKSFISENLSTVNPPTLV